MRNHDDARPVSPGVTEVVQVKRRDQELLASFRDGDLDAFDEIVRRHRRRLFVIALRRVGGVEAAEDAVQVALSKAYRHIVRLPADVDLGAWLNTVVDHAAVDQGRSETRHRRLADRAFAAAPERSDRRGSERRSKIGLGRLEREELGKILHDGIQALPDPYRRALELYHIRGVPVEEAAAVLSLNVNTLKSHLARGRSILRRRLGPKLREGTYL